VLSAYLSRKAASSCGDRSNRAPRDAPFLRLDRDPYLGRRPRTAVLDPGRLYRRRRVSLFRATDDGFSYIRNSVENRVDAYQGELRFYVRRSSRTRLAHLRAALPLSGRSPNAAGLRFAPPIRATCRDSVDSSIPTT